MNINIPLNSFQCGESISRVAAYCGYSINPKQITICIDSYDKNKSRPSREFLANFERIMLRLSGRMSDTPIIGQTDYSKEGWRIHIPIPKSTGLITFFITWPSTEGGPTDVEMTLPNEFNCELFLMRFLYKLGEKFTNLKKPITVDGIPRRVGTLLASLLFNFLEDIAAGREVLDRGEDIEHLFLSNE